MSIKKVFGVALMVAASCTSCDLFTKSVEGEWTAKSVNVEAKNAMVGALEKETLKTSTIVFNADGTFEEKVGPKGLVVCTKGTYRQNGKQVVRTIDKIGIETKKKSSEMNDPRANTMDTLNIVDITDNSMTIERTTVVGKETMKVNMTFAK